MRKPVPRKKKAPEKKLPTPPDFGQRLQEARRKSGISQADLARRLHSNVTTISRYESAGVLPSIMFAAQIAQVIGVSLDQLAGLAQEDGELVALARKLGAALNDKHREALQGQLEALLELAKGAALSPPKRRKD